MERSSSRSSPRNHRRAARAGSRAGVAWASVAVVAAGALAWAVLGGSATPPASRTDMPLVDTSTLARPASFSFVVFAGDVSSALPQLFSACKYSIDEQVSASGGVAELYEGIREVSGRDNSIVRKAVYFRDGFTVVLDPEMVLATNTEEIRRFCAANKTCVVSLIWERVSETAQVLELTSTETLRDACYQEGSPVGTPKNAPKALAASPDARGLRESLVELHVPASVLEGHVSAVRYTLRE